MHDTPRPNEILLSTHSLAYVAAVPDEYYVMCDYPHLAILSEDRLTELEDCSQFMIDVLTRKMQERDEVQPSVSCLYTELEFRSWSFYF